MTFYRTCRHCAVDQSECGRRAQVAASIKGLGLTSVKFRCSERTELYRPGDRVSAAWPVYPEDGYYVDGATLESWPATVVQKTDKGFLILVDDVPSDHETPARDYIKAVNLFCNVSPSRLAKLDEPQRRICSSCLNPTNSAGLVENCDSEYTGPHCFNRQT